ncbi:MAG: DUF6382 domain-containing protein [Lachnospiraceae bacterium]|nr:DUF6382 domain-containing protein [Lachnospiraceae bacterium]MDY5496610.1 DUF6382 domain-containing protein [Anaerobutyricum sp.]
MKVIREGLHVYREEKAEISEYFLSVEYEMIKRNAPDSLLPLILREQDNEQRILYEITGKISLEEAGNHQGFDRKQCEKILEDIIALLKDMDDYMLDFSCVSFLPENIYQDEEENLRWMYQPGREESVEKKQESIFSWLLTRVNYDDREAVQFVYQSFGIIKKTGLSKKVLEKCLEKRKNQEEIPEPVSYEEFFPSENTAVEEGQKKKEKEKEGKKRIVSPIFFSVLLVCMFLSEGCLLVWWAGEKFPGELFRYIVGNSILLFLCLAGIIRSLKKRGEEKKEINEDTAKRAEEENRVASPQIMWENVEWEEEGRTTVLGVRRREFYPMLLEKDTGKVYYIRECPYYIGSDQMGNQLQIQDRTVSRHHAIILSEPGSGEYCVRDLSSTNGTWVNEKKLGEEDMVLLRDGMLLRFAQKEFQFVFR